MKYTFLVSFTAMAYFAFAATVYADQFGMANPAGYPGVPQGSGQPTWFTPPPARMDDPGQSPAGNPNWLTPVSFLNANGPPTQAPPPCDAPIKTDCIDYCCAPPWVHRCGVFAELLYLRARDAEVAYAVPIDGAIVPPAGPAVQAGPVAVADPDYAAGFRIGGTCALDVCSSVGLSWARFQSSTNSVAGTTAPLVLRSLVLHPGTANAGADFLDARATSDVDFDLVDADYRAVWASDDLWALNYVVGVRYARLNQDFNATYTSTGTVDTLLTKTSFDGVGLRLGLDGERHASSCGLLVYGRAAASFVAGDFRSRYLQGSDVDPVIVDTTWKAGRVVTILDLELGAGWQSQCGRFRLTGGYLFSSWLNAIPTDQWIQAVQRNNFVGLGDNITFDGFTARATYNF
jgi:hypothetical protein